MNVKKIEEDLDKYKRSYKQIVGRNAHLEAQYKEQENRIAVLTAALENCQQAVDMNKTLLRKMGEEHASKEAGLVDFMNRLKKKLREFWDGDLDKLGNEGN